MAPHVQSPDPSEAEFVIGPGPHVAAAPIVVRLSLPGSVDPTGPSPAADTPPREAIPRVWTDTDAEDTALPSSTVTAGAGSATSSGGAAASSPAHVLPAELIILGRVIGPVELVIQPTGPGRRAGTGRPTAGQVDAAWRAAFRTLRAVSHPAIPALDLRVLGAEATTPPRHGPIAWCHQTRQVIRPLCARCLGPLRTLRNEQELQRLGLPSYRGTPYRFVACPQCLDATDGTPLYTEDTPPLAESVAQRLRRGPQIHRDLAPHLDDPDAPKHPAASTHPCFGCAHRPTCYPPKSANGGPLPAEDRIDTISYHDTLVLPYAGPPAPATFEQTAAFLGGCATRPRESFWFAGDLRGAFALECFHLKVRAFAQVAQGVAQVHQTTGRPHLGLSPDAIFGRFDSAIGAPQPWETTLRLGEFAAAHPIAGFDPAVTLVPWVRLPGADTSYTPQRFREVATLGGSGHLRLHDAVEVAVDGRRRVQVEGDVELPEELAPHASSQIALRIDGAADGKGFVLYARATSTSGRMLAFRGTLRLDVDAPEDPEGTTPTGDDTGPGYLDVFQRLANGGDADPAPIPVDLTLITAPDASADTAALGVLWLRWLLCNDTRDHERIDLPACLRIGRTLNGGTHPRPHRTGAPPTTDILEAFRTEGIPATVERVLYRAEDRARGAMIDEGLWGEALLLGLEMAAASETATTEAPAGKVTPPGKWKASAEVPGDASDMVLRRSLEGFHSLIERSRSTLLGTSGDNRFVLEACQDFLADLKDAIRAESEPPPEPFVTQPDSAEMTIVMRRPPIDPDPGATQE